MLAFELYCLIPNGQDTVNNPQIAALANAIGRSPNSVKLKLQNFKSYDPSYTQDGRTGLRHASALDEGVCREFSQNLGLLIAETSAIKKKLGLPQYEEASEGLQEVIVTGGDRDALRKERLGQALFRRALLAAYNNTCCFTGIAVPDLLRASHIKPWVESNSEKKTNPRNGLLLNALHDAAFDKGYVTITVDYKIKVSRVLLTDNEPSRRYFAPLHGRSITLPSRFLPDRQFIEHHNEIFRG
ncbi:MAG: HNH endonuclease [Oscillospiraceae bacterium]|jgi:putative restriction endonuclease|nr:HNH endonuclease [Oscillospiraceae bacterium]